MLTPIDRHGFLASLLNDYEGSAKIEIDLGNSDVRFEEGAPVFVQFWIRLLLGKPEQISGETVYPVELPGTSIYDFKRDGYMPRGEMSSFLMRRALEDAAPGASRLLDRECETLLEIRGIGPTDMGTIVEMVWRAKGT